MQQANVLTGLIGTLQASAALAYKNRFVGIDASGDMEYCAAGGKAVGVILAAASDDEQASYASAGNIVRVLLGGTVTYGDELTSMADGKAIKKIASNVTVHKAADEDKASDTAYADDTVFADIAIAAGQKYKLYAKFGIKNAKAGTASIKMKLTGPASCTCVGSILGRAAVNGTVTKSDDDADLAAEFTHQISTSETGVLILEGYVDNSAGAAGVIAVQWAQNASNAGAISILSESFLSLEDVDPQALNGISMGAGASDTYVAVLVK